LKVDFDRTLKDAERDEQDLDYIAKHHAYYEVSERFGVGFSNWYSYLEASLYLKDGGFPFGGNDFTEYEWQAMGIISNHKRSKEWQSTQARPK
jgi:hypothetical protein